MEVREEELNPARVPPSFLAATRSHSRLQVPVAVKFGLAVGCAVAWMGVAVWLSIPWLSDLRGDVGLVGAIVIVALTDAVAGAVLVRNSRANLLARMQEWDYYLGIAAVKRMQGLYQSTLVAEGAFSVYRTDKVRRVGGWPDAIGEDIVVTWRLMELGDRVFTEPTAVAFTDVPTELQHFMRQRSRWARGMFEGIRAVPPWRQRRVLAKFVAGIDLLIPFLDIGYVLVWLPGLLLCLFGYPIIVSVWTLLVLPITFVVYGALRRFQSTRVFRPLGLHVRHNRLGYVAFLLCYQVLCSTASLIGYSQELARRRRVWK